MLKKYIAHYKLMFANVLTIVNIYNPIEKCYRQQNSMWI